MTVTHEFTCWATLPGGAVRRIEVQACTQDRALQEIFERFPNATGASCRPQRDEPPRHGDALALLDARRCA